MPQNSMTSFVDDPSGEGSHISSNTFPMSFLPLTVANISDLTTSSCR